jgi:hypothetical protein
MAGVAGLLVFGTLSSTGSASDTAVEEDPTAYVPVELPGAEAPAAPEAPALTGNIVPAQCKGNVCTITFPKVGDSAQVFGVTAQAMAFYNNGMEISIAGNKIVSDLKTASKAGGYTLKIVKVDPSGQTVKITKAK